MIRQQQPAGRLAGMVISKLHNVVIVRLRKACYCTVAAHVSISVA
jgi:hypothetical protein